MKTGAEDKRKKIAAIVLGCLAGGLVIWQVYGLMGDDAPPPRPAQVAVATTTVRPAAGAKTSGPAATKVGTTAAQLDPTLHMGPMLVTESVMYTGSGRNIFSGEMVALAVVDIPKPLADARKVVIPPPPKCPPDCPPPPAKVIPPINLKFFGTATAANGTRRAFLLNGDDVFVASTGDVVERRYRVVSISANSILVEDIPNSNKQTLPLVGN